MQNEKQCRSQTWENWRAGLSNQDLSEVRTVSEVGVGPSTRKKGLLKDVCRNIRKIYTATSAFTKGMSSDVMYLGSDFPPPPLEKKSQRVRLYSPTCPLDPDHCRAGAPHHHHHHHNHGFKDFPFPFFILASPFFYSIISAGLAGAKRAGPRGPGYCILSRMRTWKADNRSP